jgi:hypothetical protein
LRARGSFEGGSGRAAGHELLDRHLVRFIEPEAGVDVLELEPAAL